MASSLKPLEKAERCLIKIETIRLRWIDREILLCGPEIGRLFDFAAAQVCAAGEPSLAARIEAAKTQPGQPECNLVAAVRTLIRARALPVGRAA